MLRIPSVNPDLDRRIAALEELLTKLASAPDRDQVDYLPWKEEFLRDRIAELKRDRR